MTFGTTLVLYTGVFHDCLKLSVVTAPYKLKTSYYRPVALLMLLSIVFR